jgi:beta-phosphoglucomutase-like phosphatase (HAD superfamily)
VPTTLDVPSFIRGLIFDCDGTLVDSMPLHMEAWKHVLGIIGAVWDYDFFFSKKGMEETNIVRLYNSHAGTSLDPYQTVHAKHEYFRNHIAASRPIEHVVDVAKKYYGVLPMAVASGGTGENVIGQLDAIGIRHLFSVIVTADDAVRPKPDPEIFLVTAERIGVSPEACQVFEDGDIGLEAARKAGMLATDIRERP